ncbi:glycosyltransferase [Dechloromonas sp.]|uniref:glycosyltransferase n=1 Tax=Dechloromonas sp. TaxID=1917218 RepID=UPI00286DE041|nr:glycosyltransferase [Dechloromonas sp.]
MAALTTGRNDPSARFRVRQYILPLKSAGIEVQEYIPVIDKHAGLPSVIGDRTPSFMLPTVQTAWRWGKLVARVPGLIGSSSADYVWLNRELLPGRYSFERFLRKPFVLDIDDAVWRGRPDGTKTMKRLGQDADAIFAGNQHIADWFAPYSRNIHIVPTAIDTDRFRPADQPSNSQRPFTIGWTGTSGNFGYLYDIEDSLREFMKLFDARLLIIAESPPSFSRLDPSKVDFKRWSPEIEASALQTMDVGLMPLPDTEWTRGKCSFKMLQYLSTGLPVIVSPVGMNAEVLDQGRIGFGATSCSDWFEALAWLHRNRRDAQAMGEVGRRLILERYSTTVVSCLIANAFKKLANKSTDQKQTLVQGS